MCLYLPVAHDLSEVIKTLEMIEPPKKHTCKNVVNKSVGLGVSICLDMVSIETLDLDTSKS